MISIDSHATVIQAELFSPAAGSSNGAAIIVAHGSDGMNEPWAAMIREYARELAVRGFTAVIPHYFDKTHSIAGPRIFSEISTNLLSWQEAVADTVTHVRTMPGPSITHIGLLGFSLGGHICLRIRGSADAVVEFFAPEFPELGGIGSAASGPLPIQIHHGLADLLVPFSNAENIAATLKAEGSAPEVFSYEGAGHGFASPDPNNATARRSSKDRALTFFGKHTV